jgi:uncharacterized protein YjbI with pentapeptide repeats
MTLRSWLELLVVPLALVVIGFLFSVQKDARQQRIEDQRAQEAQKIENQRAEAERSLANQRAQDEALQAYLDQMNTLMLEKDLRNSEEDSEVRTLARARTLTVLRRVDASRKGEIIRFLIEADLAHRVRESAPVIELGRADLSGAALGDLYFEANLTGAHLNGANLQDANLSGAILDGADLLAAKLGDARLIGASLHDANLHDAGLSDANVRGAFLAGAGLSFANLRDANLEFANLSGANLELANLRDATLRDANLSNVRGVTGEQLEEQAKTLERATMPDGQKYEDWLKSKGSGEAGKNSGTS